MKVLKHGNRINVNILTCPQCGCEFIPSETEILRLDGEVYAHCPECTEKVYPPEDFVDEETELEKRHRRREELVSTIVDFVDFDRIHAAMKALDWKWWDFGNCGIPSAEQIEEVVIRHLRESFDNKKTFFSGGIYIKYLPKDENGDDGLDFSFVLENCCAFYDNNKEIVTIP